MNLQNELDRCEREQARCKECVNDPAWLVTLGWCDWQWEKELLEHDAAKRDLDKLGR